MQTKKQKIDFLKQNLEEYIKIARENNYDYSVRISNCLMAGNPNVVFFLSDNFTIFKYFTHTTASRLEAFAYGLPGRNKKLTISECIPTSRNIASQTIGVTIIAHSSTIVERYKIISSEPEDNCHKNIELISNKFQDLFNSLKGTK